MSGHWRKPSTMPMNGAPVICAYRWSAGDKLRVTLGCWFKGDQFPGVTSFPDGSYIPCLGWMPLPIGGLHDEFLPLHLRTQKRGDTCNQTATGAQ